MDLGLGGRFIATFEYSDELSMTGGMKANGLRIGVKHGNGKVSRLQIEMTPVDSVSASSFRFREGALGKPLVDAAILYHEGRYRIGDVETIDGKKLPVFVQLKDVTNEPHYVRVFMANLRKTLEKNPSRPQHLLTEQGIGDRLRTTTYGHAKGDTM